MRGKWIVLVTIIENRRNNFSQKDLLVGNEARGNSFVIECENHLGKGIVTSSVSISKLKRQMSN